MISSNLCALSSGGIAVVLSGSQQIRSAGALPGAGRDFWFFTADLNGDGKPELITNDIYGAVVVFTVAKMEA